MMDDVVPPKKRHPKPKPFPKAGVTEPAVSPQPAASSAPPPTPKPALKPYAIEAASDFKTPEAVAEADELEALQSLGKSKTYKPVDTPSVPASAPQTRKTRWWSWRPSTWWQWALVGLVTVLVIGGAATGWYVTHRKPTPVPKAVVVKKATPKPAQPIYSNLSGLPLTDPSLNSKPVTAVMIENSTDARPQSGLSDAGIVFEAVAEGGITRFMALYQDTAPSSVGPVRSARPYYIQWALGFDAAYAHAGGSPDGLSDITAWHVQDMNLLNYSSYARRISTRPAPHNLYSDIAQLNQLEQKQSYSSTFTGFPRITGKEAPLTQPTASTITLNPSSALYNPQYKYDPATNTYPRSIDGTAQTDANTGQQLAPKVVIAIVVPLGQGALDASGAYYSNYTVLGTGTAYVFQNGDVVQGQWHKANNTDMITFTDSAGKPLPLNRGQTWITAVSNTSQVKYTGMPATTPATR